ncbi:MAG: TRAP transporter small permease subunit, partial [Roseovarius sp.]|nr:TRAP transporter small permease subunit [Roseovarius sp.]
MKRVDWALGAVTKFLLFVAAAATLVMMSIIVLDVTLRYITGKPMQGTLEIVSYYCMAPLVYFSFAFVEHGQGHVRISLVT